MLSKLARLLLAFVCFPLLGSYGLRWAGSYLHDLVLLVSTARGLPSFFDLIGAGVGLLCGLLLAVQLVGSALQPEASPVRAVADKILIVLAVTLLADAVIPRVALGSALLEWLAPATLVIWIACAAATMSLSHLRRDLRRQPPAPPPPQPQGTAEPVARY